MAHVLLGWEFGANRGHALRLAQIADLLRARGHRVSFAFQRADSLLPEEAKGSPVWQVPLSPRLLINTAKPPYPPPATLGDILARLGFDEAELVGALVTGWRQLFEAIRPDLAIGEYAPFMLLAARGRMPTMAVGTAFDTPPGMMPRFPSLTGKDPAVPEERTLEAVNKGLAAAGALPLQALPEIFATDRQIAGTFAELDRYSEWRKEPLARPTTPLPPPEIASSEGREVFVYVQEYLSAEALLWKGLAAAGLPVRAYVPRAGDAYRKGLEKKGFIAEKAPVPFPLIAERSRLLVSHGGHGFVCSALLAGLPQVICFLDLEKQILAHAVTGMRLGGHVPMARIEPDGFAASLRQIYADDDMAQRARDAAPGFQQRYDRTMEEATADAVEELL